MTVQQVTLCYHPHEGQLLLIRKKRGIGAGKINGPGGKVDPGETPLAAAIRETQEEIGVTPVEPELRGELWFHFSARAHPALPDLSGGSLRGLPVRNRGGLPVWFPLETLPYEEMWADDREWLPLLLAGKRFRGLGDGAWRRKWRTKSQLLIMNSYINIEIIIYEKSGVCGVFMPRKAEVFEENRIF